MIEREDLEPMLRERIARNVPAGVLGGEPTATWTPASNPPFGEVPMFTYDNGIDVSFGVQDAVLVRTRRGGYIAIDEYRRGRRTVLAPRMREGVDLN